MSRDDGHVYLSTRHASWGVAGLLCLLLVTWLFGFWCGKRRAYARLETPFVLMHQSALKVIEPVEAMMPVPDGFYACVATCDAYAQALDVCARAQTAACPLRIIKTSFILKNNKPYTSYQVLTVNYPTRQALQEALIALEPMLPGVRSATVQGD